MLSNFDLERNAHKLDLPIIGVFCKDELANIERKIGSYYINLQNSNDGGGTHWVLAKIYSDSDRNDTDSDEEEEEVRTASALYFDPFGLYLPKEVSAFLKPFKPVSASTREIQDIDDDHCGWYCLCCDYVLEHKQHSNTYEEDFEKFLELWSRNPKKNATILKRILGKIK